MFNICDYTVWKRPDHKFGFKNNPEKWSAAYLYMQVRFYSSMYSSSELKWSGLLKHFSLSVPHFLLFF